MAQAVEDLVEQGAPAIEAANQVAIHFRSHPGTDQLGRIAAHIRDSRKPRMIEDLSAHLAAGGGGLTPEAEGAIRILPLESARSRRSERPCPNAPTGG